MRRRSRHRHQGGTSGSKVPFGCAQNRTKGVCDGRDRHDEGAGRRAVDTMSGSDALLWTISTDPVMRPTIVAIMILDRTPDWSEVRSRIAAPHRDRAPPSFTGGEPGAGTGPAAVRAGRRLRPRPPTCGGAPAPSTEARRDVLDLAQTMATSGFDAALPLWEAVLVEGVEAESRPRDEGPSRTDRRGGRPRGPGRTCSTRPPQPAGRRPAETAAEPDRAARGRSRLGGSCLTTVRIVDDAMDAVTTPSARSAAWPAWARRWPGSWHRRVGRSPRS